MYGVYGEAEENQDACEIAADEALPRARGTIPAGAQRSTDSRAAQAKRQDDTDVAGADGLQSQRPGPQSREGERAMNIKEILDKHKKWRLGEGGGVRNHYSAEYGGRILAWVSFKIYLA